MEQHPISEIVRNSTYNSKSDHAVLRNLFKPLFYALTGIPGTAVNMLIDGINELGTEKYPFLDEILDLDHKLKGLEESRKIVVKIFFTSGLISISQPQNDLEQSLARIPSIEKDKELNGR